MTFCKLLITEDKKPLKIRVEAHCLGHNLLVLSERYSALQNRSPNGRMAFWITSKRPGVPGRPGIAQLGANAQQAQPGSRGVHTQLVRP
jgi:hypothetical protein